MRATLITFVNSMQLVAAVVVAILLVVPAQPAIGQDESKQTSAIPIELTPDDAALMAELRSRVESLPRDEQLEKGRQILVENVERFKGVEVRKRVHLSIANLYRESGDHASAVAYYEKAGVTDGVGVGAISRHDELDALEKVGDWSEILNKATAYRDAPNVTDPEYAEFTQRAAGAMIAAGDLRGAVDFVISTAEARPSPSTFGVVETISNRVNRGPGKREEYLRGMRWLEKNSHEFAQSLRFLCNLAHAEEMGENFERSLELRKEIVAKFPETADAGSQILSISRLSLMRGDSETARMYLRLLVEGSYPDQYKELGQQTLSALSNGGDMPKPSNIRDRKPGLSWKWLVLMNVAAISIFTVGYLYFRRHRNKK